MAGAGQPLEIPLRKKYWELKPRGKFRADYNGNSGINRHKHVRLPAVHGIKRKRVRRKV